MWVLEKLRFGFRVVLVVVFFVVCVGLFYWGYFQFLLRVVNYFLLYDYVIQVELWKCCVFVYFDDVMCFFIEVQFLFDEINYLKCVFDVLDIYCIKFFDFEGIIIWLLCNCEIGSVNDKVYFKEVVVKGYIYV